MQSALLSHGAVFLLTGRVEDLKNRDLVVHLHLFALAINRISHQFK